MGIFMKDADIKGTEEKHFKRLSSTADEVETEVLCHKQKRFTAIINSEASGLISPSKSEKVDTETVKFGFQKRKFEI